MLEFIDSGIDVPNQFTLTPTGVGGTVTAAGFLLDTLTLQSTSGEPVVFENAPVTVLDIDTGLPKPGGAVGVTIKLDGVLGMNYLTVSSDGTLFGAAALGPFDFVVYDDPNLLLGLQPASPAVGLIIPLQPGLNFVSVPIPSASVMTSHGLASIIEFEGEGALLRVSRLGLSGLETTSFVGGVVSGPDFPIRPGEGYQVVVSAAATFPVTGFAAPVQTHLAPGSNLVGFHLTPSSLTAHGLLRTIGDGSVVRSITRFNPSTSRFETSGWHGSTVLGPDFPIGSGEAYFISSLRSVQGLAVPRLLPVF